MPRDRYLLTVIHRAHVREQQEVDLSRVGAVTDDIDKSVFVYLLGELVLSFTDFQKIPTPAIEKVIYCLQVVDDFSHFEVVSLVIHPGWVS
jgi:hypothetical protein